MSRFIEKLGITPGLPEEINSVGDCLAVYRAAGMTAHTVAQLVFDDAVTLWKHLKQKNEMLEALIEEALWIESKGQKYDHLKIIESATGLSLEEIKEIKG